MRFHLAMGFYSLFLWTRLVLKIMFIVQEATTGDGDNQIKEKESCCELCCGTGEVILPTLQCITCKGEKVIEKQKVLEIEINKGIYNVYIYAFLNNT